MHNGTSSQHARNVLYAISYRAGSLVSLLVSQYSQQRREKRKDPVIYVRPHSVRVLFSYQLLSNKSGSSHARRKNLGHGRLILKALRVRPHHSALIDTSKPGVTSLGVMCLAL